VYVTSYVIPFEFDSRDLIGTTVLFAWLPGRSESPEDGCPDEVLMIDDDRIDLRRKTQYYPGHPSINRSYRPETQIDLS
jgi:hypothetical protein